MSLRETLQLRKQLAAHTLAEVFKTTAVQEETTSSRNLERLHLCFSKLLFWMEDKGITPQLVANTDLKTQTYVVHLPSDTNKDPFNLLCESYYQIVTQQYDKDIGEDKTLLLQTRFLKVHHLVMQALSIASLYEKNINAIEQHAREVTKTIRFEGGDTLDTLIGSYGVVLQRMNQQCAENNHV